MRIDEVTGEIITYDDDYCPYCDGELFDEDDICMHCGEYVGIVVITMF